MTGSMDTQLQNFWVESINKEATLRFAWHLKYSRKFARDAAQIGNPSKGPRKAALVFNSSVSDKIKKLESDRKNKTLPSATVPTTSIAPKAQSKSDGASMIRDMRPASQNTHNLLYSGISALGEGRYAYLKKRKEKIPEDKYEFPILSSCQYGWKIMEYANPKPSKYARTCVIKDSFYRNSGIILG